MNSVYNVIVRPIVSERSYDLMEQGKYTFEVAKTARKDAGSFICVGVAAFILVQTMENVGMCLAMLPVVGITLPLISGGGNARGKVMS